MRVIKRLTLPPRGGVSLVTVLVLTVMSLGMPLVAAGQDTEPRLTLDPSSGLPGIAVQVSGTGFDGDCGVNLFLNMTEGPSLGFVSVGEEGTFTEELIIPRTLFPASTRELGRDCSSR